MFRLIILIFIPIIMLSDNLFNKEELDYIKTKKVIYISNQFDYEPYDYNKNNIPMGYSIDLLNLITKEIGLEVVYITKPFDELLNDLDNKKIDLVHTLFKTPQREQKYTFSVGYSKVIHSYVIRKDKKDIKSRDDLFGLRVGVTKGWNEESFFEDYPQITKVYYRTLKDKLDALSLGEIDAIISSKNVAHYNIKKYGYTNLKISNPIDGTTLKGLEDHYFATLNDDHLLIDIINKAYINLPLNDLEKLDKKWFGQLDDIKLPLSIVEKAYLSMKSEITMCVDPDWLPFERINKNSEHEGIAADFYNLFKQKGLNFRLIETSTWSQTLEYAKNRDCDIISLAMKTPSRQSYFNFTTPYIESPIVAVTKLEVPLIEGINDLKEKKIGIIKNYAVVDLIKDKYPSVVVVEVDNMQEGLKLVSSNKIFAFVDTLPSLTYNYENLKNYNLKVAGKLGINWELGIAVRNDDQTLYNILEKAVESLTYIDKKNIFDKWLNSKYKKEVDYSFILNLITVFMIILALFLYKQKLMKKSLDEFSNLIDSTLEAILIFEKGKCINANKSAINIFSYGSKKDFIDKDLSNFIGDESKELVIDNYRIAKSLSFEILAKKSNGEKFNALVSFSKMKYKKSIVFSVIDITPLKQLETQSKQSQMGEMIENIAHQWRQPLSSISTIASAINLTLMVGVEQSKENLSRDMDKIVKTTQHLSSTIDIFRNFLKEEKVVKQFILQDKINVALEIVHAALKNNYIELRNKIRKEPVTISTIAGELEQVLINIINNAKDVLKDRKINNPWIEIDLIVDENSIIITIEDNAKGIDKTILNKIFNPYFTTKHSSQGTGLGLYMSHKIITGSLKGKLLVTNTDNGAKFYIEIPKKLEV